jgi:hypothetical protein
VGVDLGFNPLLEFDFLSGGGSEGMGLERSEDGRGGRGGTGGGSERDGPLVLAKLGMLGYVESDVRDSLFFFFNLPKVGIPLFLFPTDWESLPTSDIAV